MLEQHHRLAEDLVAAYNSADEDAITRLNDLFHSSLNIEQIRQFVRDKLYGHIEQDTTQLTGADAQLLFAKLYGFKDWAEVVRSSNEPQRDLRSGLSVPRRSSRLIARARFRRAVPTPT